METVQTKTNNIKKEAINIIVPLAITVIFSLLPGDRYDYEKRHADAGYEAGYPRPLLDDGDSDVWWLCHPGRYPSAGAIASALIIGNPGMSNTLVHSYKGLFKSGQIILWGFIGSLLIMAATWVVLLLMQGML